MVRRPELRGNDQALFDHLFGVIDVVLRKAHWPGAVANRIAIKFGGKQPVRQLELDVNDEALVERVLAVIDEAVQKAHQPDALAKHIIALAARYRDRGRTTAMKLHRFEGVCEATGLPLDRKHAILEDLEPQHGYVGRVRWVCQRAHDGGKHSCGGCK
jgi:hypothetical protein